MRDSAVVDDITIVASAPSTRSLSIALVPSEAVDPVETLAALGWYLGAQPAAWQVTIVAPDEPARVDVLNALHSRDDFPAEVIVRATQLVDAAPWTTAADDYVMAAAIADGPDVLVAQGARNGDNMEVAPDPDRQDIFFAPNEVAGSASLMSYLATSADPTLPTFLAQSREWVRVLCESERGKTAAVFGTGPSFESIDWSRFADTANIVCNSIVNCVDDFDRIRPIAVCAADPVFHSSHTPYADDFRAGLIEALDHTEMPFFFPTRDLAIYRSALPERLHHRFAPVPLAARDDFNLDLAAALEVKSTANILTLLLLPLAFTLSRSVYVGGCDGKSASSNYFWTHSSSAQFGDRIQSVKDLFPGFFEIDYDEYYASHLATLDQLIDEGEQAGRFVRSATPSFIPALQARELNSPGRIQGRETSIVIDAFADLLALNFPLGVGVIELGALTLGLAEALDRACGPSYRITEPSRGDAIVLSGARNQDPTLSNWWPPAAFVCEFDEQRPPTSFAATTSMRLIAVRFEAASGPGERATVIDVTDSPALATIDGWGVLCGFSTPELAANFMSFIGGRR